MVDADQLRAARHGLAAGVRAASRVVRMQLVVLQHDER
jgi:hypothetical protein